MLNNPPGPALYIPLVHISESLHSLHSLRNPSAVPGGGLKLKGEDDAVGVADLANEALLSAEVTVVDMVGCKLDQGQQEGLVLAVCDLHPDRHTGR